MEFTVHQAKTQFSKLLAQANAGEEVVITSGRERKPVAKLVGIPKQQTTSRIGFAIGIWPVPGPEFYEPLPDDELALWNGEGE